ncbi:hypothetical protein [Streptomyces sp. NPDC095817]
MKRVPTWASSTPAAGCPPRVRATQTKVDEENWVGLVQLLPAAS